MYAPIHWKLADALASFVAREKIDKINIISVIRVPAYHYAKSMHTLEMRNINSDQVNITPRAPLLPRHRDGGMRYIYPEQLNHTTCLAIHTFLQIIDNLALDYQSLYSTPPMRWLRLIQSGGAF